MQAGRQSKLHRFCTPVGAALLGLLAALYFTNAARADEGGVSFWLPGLFGSLAAAPQQPGWSLMTTYYHTTVSGGGDVAFRANSKFATSPPGYRQRWRQCSFDRRPRAARS